MCREVEHLARLPRGVARLHRGAIEVGHGQKAIP
jgi:hypothetical protein